MMKYVSTRDNSQQVTAAHAISQGISRERGLFVPQSFPQVGEEELSAMGDLSYVQRAALILGKYLTDFTREELLEMAGKAYGGGKFDDEAVAPLSKVGEGMYILELWHGPTCAFKDMALQMLPLLMTRSVEMEHPGRETVILVATSGDTGKAALEGFKDVPGTRILVFYPENGVSDVQKLQMVTQEGENVGVCGVKGNFDDAQTAVKNIFTSREAAEKLAEKGMAFSSANSINWGRLVPQVVYYFSAYAQLLHEGEISPGEVVNVAVPTGNFGNILAAYYAKRMGLPIGKLICASNRNKVLADFFQTGVYDRNREFYETISPSMDILISSNLERLLYHLHGEDDGEVRRMMGELESGGKYRISPHAFQEMKESFAGGFADDVQTKATIARYFKEYGYLPDTHTAVALQVYQDYRESTGDTRKVIVASTANPHKFADSVLEALTGEKAQGDELARARQLESLTGVACPPQLIQAATKPRRFDGSVAKEEISSYVLSTLGLR